MSFQTGFSIHPRYVLPALPFMFVGLAALVVCSNFRDEAGGAPAAVALVRQSSARFGATRTSCLISTEAGWCGPKRGHRHLLDSGIAWGQDLIFLREWLDEHPKATPFYLAAFGYLNPAQLGIDYELPPP